jgi:hypothetical protein
MTTEALERRRAVKVARAARREEAARALAARQGLEALLRLDREKAATQAEFKAAWDAAPEAARDEFARLAILGDAAELESDDGPTKVKGAGR